MNEDEIISKLGIQKHDFRLVFGRSKIDYDDDKENANQKKHGYSLESAVHFLEQMVLETIIHPEQPTPFLVSDPFMHSGEVRHKHMGLDTDGHVVFFVTTMRSDETIRVISFRRAGDKEIEIFKKHVGYKGVQGTPDVKPS